MKYLLLAKTMYIRYFRSCFFFLIKDKHLNMWKRTPGQRTKRFQIELYTITLILRKLLSTDETDGTRHYV